MPHVLHTGPAADASATLAAIREVGFDVVSLPSIVIEAVPVDEPLRQVVAAHAPIAAVIVTSRNALASLAELRPWIDGVDLFVVGAETARRAEALGWRPAAVGRDGADHLADLVLARGDLRGRTVLFPCGDRARPTIVERLTSAGVAVIALGVYRTRGEVIAPGRLRDAVPGAQAVIFTSPSGVESFLASATAAGLAHEVRTLLALSLGRTTDEAAARAGFGRRAVSERPSPRALADALAARLKQP